MKRRLIFKLSIIWVVWFRGEEKKMLFHSLVWHEPHAVSSIWIFKLAREKILTNRQQIRVKSTSRILDYDHNERRPLNLFHWLPGSVSDHAHANSSGRVFFTYAHFSTHLSVYDEYCFIAHDKIMLALHFMYSPI